MVPVAHCSSADECGEVGADSDAVVVAIGVAVGVGAVGDAVVVAAVGVTADAVGNSFVAVDVAVADKNI